VTPGDRMETYSASTSYTRALVAALDDLFGSRPRRVGLGASLGALALLHAHRIEPRAFAGLFLQSGSYFRRRTDAQESRFPRFSRIDRFVGTVLNAKDGARPVPTTITCGLDEENYGNNAAIAQALAAQGYGVDFHAARGGHDWPTWRRALDAHLAPLLRRAWR
jgi:enterochelin esterase-like enzyme